MSRLAGATVLVVVTALAGCGDTGPPLYPVKGVVQLADGTPVETGTVEFTSEDGAHTARALIGKDGSFSLSTIAGAHKGVVLQLIMTEDLPLHEHDHGPTIHPDFSHYRRSGLSIDVDTDGDNEFALIVRAQDE